MMSILEFLPKAAVDAQHMSGLLTLAGNEIIALRAELKRCVFLLDGACTLPNGSNADTSRAHELLGDFEKHGDDDHQSTRVCWPSGVPSN